MIETRKSISRPLIAHLEAAVLRHAPLGDVEFGHDLDARDHLLRGHAADGERLDAVRAGRVLRGLRQNAIERLHALAVARQHRSDVAWQREAGLERLAQRRIGPGQEALAPRIAGDEQQPAGLLHDGQAFPLKRERIGQRLEIRRQGI
jgi:hypothetical protein